MVSIKICYVFLQQGKIRGYLYKLKGTNELIIGDTIYTYNVEKRNIKREGFNWTKTGIRVNKEVPRINLDKVHIDIDYAYEIYDSNMSYNDMQNYIKAKYNTLHISELANKSGNKVIVNVVVFNYSTINTCNTFIATCPN